MSIRNDIKNTMDNTGNVTAIVGAILLAKESSDQYVKQYNQGIKNGESQTQAIVSATISTLAYFGLEAHIASATFFTISDAIAGKDVTELSKQQTIDDINGMVDKAFDYLGFNEKEKSEVNKNGQITNDNNPIYKMQENEQFTPLRLNLHFK